MLFQYSYKRNYDKMEIKSAIESVSTSIFTAHYFELNACNEFECTTDQEFTMVL